VDLKSLIRELISLSLSSMVKFVYSFNTTIATCWGSKCNNKLGSRRGGIYSSEIAEAASWKLQSNLSSFVICLLSSDWQYFLFFCWHHWVYLFICGLICLCVRKYCDVWLIVFRTSVGMMGNCWNWLWVWTLFAVSVPYKCMTCWSAEQRMQHAGYQEKTSSQKKIQAILSLNHV
jgi:hypothetical protein